MVSWDDHHTGTTAGGGKVHTVLVGTAPNRIRIIEWFVTVPRNASGPANTRFQLWLHETTNLIDFVYGASGGTTASTSYGLGDVIPEIFLSVTTAAGGGTASTTTANNSNTIWPGNGTRYRFTPGAPPALDLAFVSLSVPIATCPNNALPVTATIRNAGNSVVDFSANNLAISTNVTGASTQTLTGSLNSGTLAPGATQVVALTNANVTATGIHSFKGRLQITGDTYVINDTVVAPVQVYPSGTTPVVSNFTGYTGANLATIFPGWNEGVGATSPVIGNSAWTSTTGVGGASNVTAKLNLFTNSRVEWLVTPKFTVAANMGLAFDVAVTDFASTTTSDVMGSDDRVSVMISTDCGVTWTELKAFTAADNLPRILRNYTVDLSAYTGQSAIIGFKATDGPVDDLPDYDFHIDNVNIDAGCSTAPVAGTLSANPATACYNETITLSLTGATAGIGVTYQWQRSPIAVTDWVDLPGATSTSYVFNAIGSYRYRVVVKCIYNNLTDNTAPLTVSVSAPVSYASFPYTQGFESWINGCGTTDRPSSNWGAAPATGNNSWRRYDQGSSASWGNLALGGYTPASTNGSHSARFHSYQASSGSVGFMDLWINLSDPSTNKYLTFDYINTSGSDVLAILLSTDGGLNFTQVGANLGVQAAWGKKEFRINSTSATTIIRFRATSDFGTTDIGIDSLSVINGCSGTPTGFTAAAAAATVCYGEPIALSLTGGTILPGISYQWQQSFDGTTWTDLAGATTASYTVPAVYLASQFRAILTCSDGSASGTSTAVSVGVTSQPVYATLPHVQGFEAWTNGCGTSDRPGPNWGNSPITGESSWRRHNEGQGTAGWTNNGGIYSPVSTEGTASARFHSNTAPAGSTGTLDLFIDLSSATSDKLIRFDYINTSGSDSLVVFFSANGGQSFVRLDSIQTRSAWFTKSIILQSNSATAVVRFRAYSDDGTTDIGLDNVKVLVGCTGSPAGGAVSGPGGSSTVCLGNSLTLGITGQTQATGITYQWQVSSNNVNWTDTAGATSETITISPTTNTWYRAIVVCSNTNDTSYAASLQVSVDNPLVTSTTAATRCGYGTATLQAVSTPGASLSWYTAAQGGSLVGTGTSFTTPNLSATTTYYVAANTGVPLTSVGAASVASFPNAGTFSSTNAGILFDVLGNGVRIQSVDIFPTSPIGTRFKIVVRAGGGGGQIIATYQDTLRATGTTANPVAVTVPVNFTIPQGTGYAMTFSDGAMSAPFTGTAVYPEALRNNPATGVAFPYQAPGLLRLTDATLSGVWYYFYNWQVTNGCVSPRTAVTATVTPPPTFDLPANTTVCNNAVTPLSVASSLVNYDSYIWTPATGLFTDPGATIPYTGDSRSIVFAKLGTPGVTTYYVNALNTTSNCADLDSVKLNVLPGAITISATTTNICTSGQTSLRLDPATGYSGASFEWQSSTDGTNFTTIAAATGLNFNTPVLTATTHYRVIVKDAAGNSCLQSTITINVSNPQLLTGTGANRCGAGTLTLQATSSTGTTINWYTAAVGGSLVGSGTSFTTPNLTATTTYYAAAIETSGAGIASVGAGANTSTSYESPFYHFYGGRRSQYMILASELYAAGIVAGNINSLAFDVVSPGVSYNDFRIGIKTTTAAAMTGTLETGFTSVYTAPSVTPVAGINTYAFLAPFAWDGSSNIIVEICWSNNNTGGTSATVRADNTSYVSHAYYRSDNETSAVICGTTSATSTQSARPKMIFNATRGCQSARTPVAATINDVTAITTQPVDQAACPGGNVIFSVASAGVNLTYQWRKGANNIAGATNDSLILSNVSAADAGSYSVVITGLCGSATSATVNLTVSATNNWVGTVSSDWNVAANWCGNVPTASSDVLIPSGTPFQPVINGLANVRSLTINAGASLTVSQNAPLNIFGNFTSNGSFTAPNGLVFFRGTSNQTVGAITAGAIIVNGAGITLAGNMTAGTNLVLLNGNITLGSNNITINGSATGSASSHIITNGTGSVIANGVGLNPVEIPVGPDATSYNPAIISNGQGRNFTVRVVTGHNPAIANSGRAINRTWHITPNTAPPANVNILLQYADADANASASPTAIMEVGVHNGTAWALVTPAVTPSGLAASRQVGIQTTQFGPTVIGNAGAIHSVTAVPSIDPDVTGIMLMPNLVQSNTVLRVNMRRTMKVSWNIIDMNGRVVMVINQQMLTGQNDIQLQLGHLAAGMYHIIGGTEQGRTKMVRFIKQ
ncbi:MAG TPA: hypothetical protein VFR58_13420 [Flavisolibacter sp.]|nr:hypothetical protein [Flavisolibacter sp.]